MEFILKRQYFKSAYTIGSLYLDRRWQCNTMEPPSRHIGQYSSAEEIAAAKSRGPTAIPTGRYPIVVTRSPKFGKWLPLLVGVHGFSGIRIHAGNKPSDTQGCILPGYNRHRGYVLQSTACLNEIMRKLQAAYSKGEAAWITIKE